MRVKNGLADNGMLFVYTNTSNFILIPDFTGISENSQFNNIFLLTEFFLSCYDRSSGGV
jgi:hypothetical protein